MSVSPGVFPFWRKRCVCEGESNRGKERGRGGGGGVTLDQTLSLEVNRKPKVCTHSLDICTTFSMAV